MEGSEVSTSGVKCRWVKCSEGLSNGVSNIIRSYKVCCLYGFFVYHILSCSLGSIFYHCIYGCMFRVLLFNFVNYVFYWYVYVFLLLCVFCSAILFSLCCSMYCLCVNVYCTTATGCQPNCNPTSYHAMEPLDINTVCTGYRNNYHSIITRQHKQKFYYF